MNEITCQFGRKPNGKDAPRYSEAVFEFIVR
jgi:hypothetical protein